MEIVNSILLIFLNFLIAKFILKRNFSSLGYSLIPAFLFIILNLFLGDLPAKLIPATLVYSFGLLILSFMSSRIDVTKNNKADISEEKKEMFRKIKFYMMTVIMPIGITLFQIVLMFNKKVQAGFYDKM